MIVPITVAEALKKHVALIVECIDRMYLNVYIPKLQSEPGVVGFFRNHRGAIFASSSLMEPISRAFVSSIQAFIKKRQIPVVRFAKNQRKDDVAKEYLARFKGEEGVLFVGVAQEKAYVFSTEKRRNPQTGLTYPWIVRSKRMVNYYYFYCVDRDFGPFFIKFCSYFPYSGKLCINGHEYVKRQLDQEGIGYTPLDNGIATCDNPERLQQICDGLDARTIEALFTKWLDILPQPLTQEDRNAGYQYQLSVLQAEFSLTLMLDRPLTGRKFFECLIKDNLIIGRPDNVQLIFERRITKRTPGRFRTRIITEGVIPSLHLDYKHSRIKIYFKEGRALRIETTINNTKDFGIGKRLTNLSLLRNIGFAANRRVMEVQRLTEDPTLALDTLKTMSEPLIVNGVRTSALPFANQSTQDLLQALPIFRLQANGFANKDLRDHLAGIAGKNPDQISLGQMSYKLRRLRLRGLIERMPKSHRYRVTDFGLRVATFYTVAYNRMLQPGLTAALGAGVHNDNRLAAAFNTLQKAMDHHASMLKIAA